MHASRLLSAVFAFLLHAHPCAAGGLSSAAAPSGLAEYRQAWKAQFEALGKALVSDVLVLEAVPDKSLADIEAKASALRSLNDPETLKRALLEAKFLRELRSQAAAIQSGRDLETCSGPECPDIHAAAVGAVALKAALDPQGTQKVHSLYDKRVRDARAPAFVSQADAVLYTQAIQTLLGSPSLPEQAKKALGERAALYAKALGGLVFEDGNGIFHVVGSEGRGNLSPEDISRMASEKPRATLPEGFKTDFTGVPAPVKAGAGPVIGAGITRSGGKPFHQATLAAGSEAAGTAFPGLRDSLASTQKPLAGVPKPDGTALQGMALESIDAPSQAAISKMTSSMGSALQAMGLGKGIAALEARLPSSLKALFGGDSAGRPQEKPEVPEIRLGAKIQKQMPKRGWTEQSLQETIRRPHRMAPTQDTRHLPGGGQAHEPATAYINKDGSYVVRNNLTGDIVQVSNRNDPHWVTPFK